MSVCVCSYIFYLFVYKTYLLPIWCPTTLSKVLSKREISEIKADLEKGWEIKARREEPGAENLIRGNGWMEEEKRPKKREQFWSGG